MLFSPTVSTLLDERNLAFTSAVKTELADLSAFATPSLNWLMVEHYQFSFRNTVFLARAAEVADELANPDIASELRRNLAEENGHAAMYRAALRRIGIDVDEREPFPPTDYFLYRIAGILEGGPSFMLGATYATETAAIFEHEVFLEISRDVVARGRFGAEGRPLLAFHEMHLSGVEQSHKDELGIFLRHLDAQRAETNADGVSGTVALCGGQRAIDTMSRWWQDLLTHVSAPGHVIVKGGASDCLELV
jgi:hypothetical protein